MAVIIMVFFLSAMSPRTIEAWFVSPRTSQQNKMMTTFHYHHQGPATFTKKTSLQATSSSTQLFASNATEASTDDDSDDSTTSEQQQPSQRKRGYVRVEEWDAEQKKNGGMEWDEKVKFDGQRQGNRWQQNEILRHNLFK